MNWEGRLILLLNQRSKSAQIAQLQSSSVNAVGWARTAHKGFQAF